MNCNYRCSLCIFSSILKRHVSLSQVRSRYTYEPPTPPFFDKVKKFSERIDKLSESAKQAAEQNQQYLDFIPGIDLPLTAGDPREKIFACSNMIADSYKLAPGMPFSEQAMEINASKFENWRALRKVKKAFEDFDQEYFIEDAFSIYKELFEQLSRHPMKKEKLLKSCTEFFYQSLSQVYGGCQLKWVFVDTAAPPQLLHVRTAALDAGREFAQITVMFNNILKVARYDRFGRLIEGDPSHPQTVKEHIVFERNLGDDELPWRVHGKLEPLSDTTARTFIIPDTYRPLFDDKQEPANINRESNKWNKKWADPGYYQLSDHEQECMRLKKRRRKFMFKMKPEKRV